MVRAYRRADDAIKAAAVPPADLAARIRAACANLPAEQPAIIRLPWPMSIWRYAAAVAAVVVLVCAVAYSVMSGSKPHSGQAAMAKGASERPELASNRQPGLPPAGDRADPAPEASAGSPVTARAETEVIGSEELAMIDTDGRRGGSANPPTYHDPASRNEPVPLPVRVHHVWVVKDYARSRDFFLKNLPARTSCTQTSTASDSASVEVILQDRQLQELIDRLAASGWSLLSPGLPQPGQSQQLQATGRTVCYAVDFVRGR